MGLKIATRKSRLAQVQTDIIIAMLKNKYGIDAQKLLSDTEGDKKLDVDLDKVGGKGIFVKDIELRLLGREAAAAVHSMKDLPFELEEHFCIAAVPEREDVRDVFVSGSNKGFFDIPRGARVGTGSLRRCRQLAELRPDIEFVAIRGNIETRIKKIELEGLDGVILAAAGLKRLGFEERITNYFDPRKIVPAVGQGALAVEVVKGSEYETLFRKLDDENARAAVEAERSFMEALNGGCHSSLGAYTELHGNELYMLGNFEIEGRLIKKDIIGSKYEAASLGIKLAEKILTK